MSPHLSIVEIESGNVVRRLGVHGEGNNQFINPIWIGTGTHATEHRAWLLDWPRRRVVQLSMDSVGRHPRIVETVNLQSNSRQTINAAGALDVPTWAVVQGPRIFVGGMLLDRLFEEWHQTDGFVRSASYDLPFTSSLVPYPLSRQALSVTLGVPEPSGRRFAILHQYSSRIDFLDSVGVRYAESKGPRPVRVVVKAPTAAEEGKPGHGSHHIRVTSVDSSEIGYTAVASTKRFVYAAFCGCQRGVPPEPRAIHVFDWDGNYVREFSLDRFVGPFAVLGDTLLIGAIGRVVSNARELSLARWRIASR